MMRRLLGLLSAALLVMPAVLVSTASPAAAAASNTTSYSIQLHNEFNSQDVSTPGPMTITVDLFRQPEQCVTDPTTMDVTCNDIPGAPTQQPATTKTGPIDIDFDVETIYLDAIPNVGSPDRSCTIAIGASSCSVTVPSNGRTGQATVRAWIDRDGVDGKDGGNDEADKAEGRYAGAADAQHGQFNDCNGANDTTACKGDPAKPGSTEDPEPDGTDVGTINFFTPATQTLRCVEVKSGSAGSSTDPVTVGEGQDVTVRCQAATGASPTNKAIVDGELLRFDATNGGANDPDQTAQDGEPDFDSSIAAITDEESGCVTGTGGTCDVVIPGKAPGRAPETGGARVCFWLDGDNDTVFDAAGVGNDGGGCDVAPTGMTAAVFIRWQEATGLDATPETGTLEQGTELNITARVFSNAGAPSTATPKPVVYGELFSGAAGDTDGNTPNTPDVTFPDIAAGASTTTLTMTADSVGTLVLCVWTASTPSMTGVAGSTDKKPTCTGAGGAEIAPDATADEGTPSPAIDNTDVVTRTVTTQTTFEPVTPARLLDTRAGGTTVDGLSQGGGPKAADSTTTVKVAGRANVPGDAAAGVLNLAVTDTSAPGFLTVFPCGASMPLVSNLNWGKKSETIANQATIKLSASGDVCIYTSSATQIFVDITGYFPPGSVYTAVTPARVLDSRAAGVTSDGQSQGGGPLAANSTTTLPIAGRAGVPSGAEAVVVNLTVTESTAGGFLTAFPCGTTRPVASNLNHAAGQTIAAQAVVTVPAGGSICIYTFKATQLIVDVNGFFPAGSKLTPLSPARLLDTRSGGSTIDGTGVGAGVRPAQTTTTVRVRGRGGVPAGAASAILTVTVVDAVEGGFLTVFTCGSARPNASNLNYAAGQTIANQVTLRLSPTTGDICIYNFGATQILADVAGSF
jgi:hypothetical protein